MNIKYRYGCLNDEMNIIDFTPYTYQSLGCFAIGESDSIVLFYFLLMDDEIKKDFLSFLRENNSIYYISLFKDLGVSSWANKRVYHSGTFNSENIFSFKDGVETNSLNGSKSNLNVSFESCIPVSERIPFKHILVSYLKSKGAVYIVNQTTKEAVNILHTFLVNSVIDSFDELSPSTRIKHNIPEQGVLSRLNFDPLTLLIHKVNEGSDEDYLPLSNSMGWDFGLWAGNQLKLSLDFDTSTHSERKAFFLEDYENEDFLSDLSERVSGIVFELNSKVKGEYSLSDDSLHKYIEELLETIRLNLPNTASRIEKHSDNEYKDDESEDNIPDSKVEESSSLFFS